VKDLPKVALECGTAETEPVSKSNTQTHYFTEPHENMVHADYNLQQL